MNSVYLLDILKTLEEWSDKLEAWLDKHYGNPILWVGIVVVGLVLFKTVFSSLNKD